MQEFCGSTPDRRRTVRGGRYDHALRSDRTSRNYEVSQVPMNMPFEEAKRFHATGQLHEAEAYYRLALDVEPDVFKVYNNLGTVLEQLGRLDEAIVTYQKGITLAPGCFLLHYNLGRAFQQTQQLSEALLTYLRALEIEPTSFETHYNLGNLLSEQGRFASAIEAYLRALQYYPECKEAHSNLGTAYFEDKRFAAAVASYRRAVEIDPESASDHFRLGRALEALGTTESAIESYRHSLALEPTSSSTFAQLVQLLLSLERIDEAEATFQSWREGLPEDPVAEHMWAAYSGEDVPSRASDAYVRATFDQFAMEFDAVLSRLGYRGPQLLLAELVKHIARPERNLHILDAGCGTGLCGPLVRPFASFLAGVDLSLGMLEKARARGCYDDLYEAELTTYLSKNGCVYDIIIASDTLIYFGDLSPVISSAANALRSQGLFLFTVEALANEDTSANFRLNRHGRYSHALEYVGLLLQRAGFEVLSIQQATLRTEASKAVRGLVVSARKFE
jgi:predicted TPR repeat methyltransferase